MADRSLFVPCATCAASWTADHLFSHLKTNHAAWLATTIPHFMARRKKPMMRFRCPWMGADDEPHMCPFVTAAYYDPARPLTQLVKHVEWDHGVLDGTAYIMGAPTDNGDKLRRLLCWSLHTKARSRRGKQDALRPHGVLRQQKAVRAVNRRLLQEAAVPQAVPQAVPSNAVPQAVHAVHEALAQEDADEALAALDDPVPMPMPPLRVMIPWVVRARAN